VFVESCFCKHGFDIITILISCGNTGDGDIPKTLRKPMSGTWRLITGTLIEKGDTAVTDYTKKISFIKIINDTFRFVAAQFN
jgi:hypothetical protein